MAQLSLESLMDIRVTSVSKKEEGLRGAAAAVFVITAEDIRRSGVNTIMDLLRTVPGLNVARATNTWWAITARGFNDVFANKLLVLIDGRSVYTPLFAGTFWDVQDVVLEDIARIEVVKGPGGTLWGANAVNGVINVITKSADETVGGLLTIGGGKEERGFFTVRYGERVNDNTAFRFYAKYMDHDGSNFASGADSKDDWFKKQLGFRLDTELSSEDHLTVQADAYFLDHYVTYDLQRPYPPYNIRKNVDGDMDGGNILARWTRTFADDSELQVQAYYDIYDRVDIGLFDERRQTFDIEILHRIPLATRHDLIWGAGYRYMTDSLHNTFDIAHIPDSDSSRLYSAFIQDEMSIIEDELNLIFGVKFEYNDYSGFEFQPNVRAAWTPNERHTVWAAISRAVRTPSRAEHQIQLTNLSLPGLIVGVIGNDGMDSENVIAYELGYRADLTENLSVDLALFYNKYKKIRSIEIGLPTIRLFPGLPHLFIPAEVQNGLDATTYGVEIVLDWRPLDWWRLRGAYSYFEVDKDLNPRTIDILTAGLTESNPEHTIRLESHMDLPRDVELDIGLHFVDRLTPFGLFPEDVSDYLDLDVRLGWKPKENLTVELVGHDLLESSRREYGRTFVNFVPTEVERGFFAKLTWTF